MRRNLVVLNLLLAALIGLVGWRLWTGYGETLRRQQAFLSAPAPAAPSPVVLIPPPPGQVSAANYYDIAAKLPFSRDRNPVVVVEVVAPKPMPALPRYYGMMNFGGAPKVILAPAPGGTQKSYVAGERIGEFRLVTIATGGLVFEWEGKPVAARFDEMRDTAPPEQKQQAQSGGAPAPAAPASGSSVTSLVSASAQKPGASTGEATKACQPGDNSPVGAVVDGYRKALATGPFGQSCRWEKVN